MTFPRTLAISVLLLASSACTESEIRVTEGRLRTDFEAELNADEGWADLTGIATVHADRPFRLRFEVEAPDSSAGLGLEVRRNRGAWTRILARDFPYPDEISTPPVSIISPSAWVPGAPTQDLLDTSTQPFSGGVGLGLDSVSGPVPAGQSEWEWAMVIRRWADGAEMMEAGDRFDFRLVDASGTPLSGGIPMSVELEIPEGLLGGTYAETPGRLGPWQSSDGHLWFPMEPAETYNVLMMATSADGGLTWTEADGARRPLTDDLEGFATAFHSGTIHILHQISERVAYHAFDTPDAPGGSSGWSVRDELVAEHPEPPVQAASLEALSDGTLVAAFASGNQIEIRMKSPGGEWTPTDTLVGRSAEGWILSGPQTAVTPGDMVHLAWTETNGSTGLLNHGALSEEGILGPRQTLATGLGGTEADVGSVAPLVYLPGADEVVIVWRRADGLLAERRIRADGLPTGTAVITNRAVTQNAVDSDQVGADLVEFGGRIHLLFLDQETGSIYHSESPGGGVWSGAEPVVEGIRGQWVRGQIVQKPDGRMVYGFVYDAGSDGGSGMNHYGEVDLGG
jgi:hypothetical protein